jgi:hypothetical protein
LQAKHAALVALTPPNLVARHLFINVPHLVCG